MRSPDTKVRYHYSRLGLRFPSDLQAPRRAAVQYRIIVLPHGGTRGSQPVAAANCRIPNTAGAVRLLSTLAFNGYSPAAQAQSATSGAGPHGHSRTAVPPREMLVFTDDKRRVAAARNAPGSLRPNADLGTAYLPTVHVWASSCPSGAYCIPSGGGAWANPGDQSQYAPDGYYYDPGVWTDVTAAPPEMLDDFALERTPPDCTFPQNDKETAWCSGKTPSSDEDAKIRAALARMAAKGGTCAALASIGTALLNSGNLHLYDQSWFTFGGAAPLNGGSTGWMALSRTWTTTFYDADHVTPIASGGEPQHRDLQQVLAHELDHLAGSDHVGAATATPDPYNTPNSNACSDITNFYT